MALWLTPVKAIRPRNVVEQKYPQSYLDEFIFPPQMAQDTDGCVSSHPRDISYIREQPFFRLRGL